MRPAWGKRGQDQPIYLLLFELVALLLFGATITGYAANAASNTVYWKDYFSRDLAQLTSISGAAQGPLAFFYPYVGQTPLKTDLLFEITANQATYTPARSIGVADARVPDEPTVSSYLHNMRNQVVPAEVRGPRYLEIRKKGNVLRVVADQGTPLEECEDPGWALDTNHVTYSITTPSGSGSIPALADAIKTQLRIDARYQGKLTQDRLEHPTADIAILVMQTPDPADPTFSIIYPEGFSRAGGALACAIRANLRPHIPTLFDAFETGPWSSATLADPALVAFDADTAGSLARIVITIPAAKASSQDLQVLASDIAHALGGTLAP